MPSLADHRVAVGVFLSILTIVVVLGFRAARWRQQATIHNLEEWGLGGRSFGPMLTWFLIGGDIYTAYTFVALPTLVYTVGASGFWPVSAVAIVYPLVFGALTRFWSVAHVHGLLTTADFVRIRFGSRVLSLLVAMAGIFLLIQYMALQLVAIEAVFETMGLTGSWPLWVAFAVVAVFTYNAGLRAPALMAVLKDVLILWVVVAAVLIVAATGGWSTTFALAANRFAATAGPADGLLLQPSGLVTYMTTALGSAAALFLCPHAVTGILAAKNRGAVRLAITAMPVYTLLMGVTGLLGFFAIATKIVPVGADPATGAPGNPLTIVPRLFDQIFPGWVAGSAFAAVVVGAFVPSAVMSIAAANLFSRNVYQEFIRPGAAPAELVRVSRVFSLAIKFVAVASILLLGLQFSLDTGAIAVLQTLPAVGVGLFTSWPHRYALLAGFVAGVLCAVAMLHQVALVGPDGKVLKAHFGGTAWPLANLGIDGGHSVYIGIGALAVNLAVTVVGTPVLRLLRVPDGEDLTRQRSYVADEGDPIVRRLDEILDGRPVPVSGVEPPGMHERRRTAQLHQRYPYHRGRHAPRPIPDNPGDGIAGRHRQASGERDSDR
jgi:solute:Na+ symporter, SSS family